FFFCFFFSSRRRHTSWPRDWSSDVCSSDLFVLPESLPKERRSKSAWHMANPLGSLTLLRSHPQLFGLASVMTLFYLAQQSLPAVFVLYTQDRKSTRLNSSHVAISYAVFCLKKKKPASTGI